MILGKKQIQAVLSSKWVVKQGRQLEASTTHLAQEQLANIQSSGGSSWDQSLEDEEPSGQPWEGDHNKLREIIKVDPLTTTWKVAEELSVDHSTVTQHLKQTGKVTNLISRCLMSWPEIKKSWFWNVIYLILYNNNEPFLDQIVICDEKWILYDNQQACQLCGWTKKKFQTTFQCQTCTNKRVTVTVWWSAVSLIYSFLNPGKTNTHLRSMLSESMRCTENCNASSQHWSTERAWFFSTTMHDLISHNQHFKSWTNWAIKFYLIYPIHPTSCQLTTTSSSISTAFCKENTSTTSRMQKMLSKSSSNPKAQILCYKKKQTYFSLAKLCWL